MEYSVTAAFGTVFAVLDDVTAPFRPGDAVSISFAVSGPVLIPDLQPS
jgi:iron(III) transport system ATP-binding protein